MLFLGVTETESLGSGEVISGYIDGIHGGDIVGWVANHGKPHELEPVIVEAVSGERMVFRMDWLLWRINRDWLKYLNMEGRK